MPTMTHAPVPMSMFARCMHLVRRADVTPFWMAVAGVVLVKSGLIESIPW